MASGQVNYRKGLRNSVYGLWAGVLDKSDFHNAMSSTIERWLTVAWNEGAAECGIGPEDLTIEEHRALLNAIDSELGHLSGYADYIVQNSKANGGKRATVFKRLEGWVRRYKDLTNRAKTMACKDKRLEWRLGATEEHCRVCNKLHGKVKRASYWEAAGLHPQDPPNDRLDCGGWNCLCTLRVTDKPVSKGPLPGGRGPVAEPPPLPERQIADWYKPPELDGAIVDQLEELGPWDAVEAAHELGYEIDIRNFMRINDRWVRGAEVEAKDDIYFLLRNNPQVRALTLYQEWSSAGSELSFREWLDQPKTFYRGGERSYPFMSFSSSESVARDASGGEDVWTVTTPPKNLLGSGMTGAGEVYIDVEAIE